MSSKDGTWTPVSNDLPILTCGYSFGSSAHAYALAAPCDGGFAIVSPPSSAPDSAYDEIEKRGKVRALVAPNAYHTLGIAPWKKRFPDAQVFAAPQAIARVAKKSGVDRVRPLSEAASLCGSDLELIEAPHFKNGETIVRMRSGKQVAWYVTDIIFNLPALPKAFPIRQLFAWTKSAPGLRPNKFATWLMMKDKNAAHRWLREELEKAPPTVAVMSHGDPVLEDAAKRLLEIIPS